jgi:hypothetical protein
MLAYIAGFFDGEGCIMATRSGRGQHRYSMNCAITQKSRGVLELIQSYFGGYIVSARGGSSNEHNNKIHRLRLSQYPTRIFLEKIAPYLIVKKQEAQIAIEYHQLRMTNKLRGEDYYFLSDSSKKHESNIVKVLHQLKKQQKSQALLMPAQTEDEKMAYVAGIFDAEGCVSISKREKHGKYYSIDHHVRCTVTQELRLLVEYMQSLFSGLVYISYKRKSKNGDITRNVYRWVVTHRKALAFLEKINNYLIIKKDQAKLGIELQNNHVGKRTREGWLTTDVINLRDSQMELMHQMKCDIVANVGSYNPISREQYRNGMRLARHNN